MTLFVDRRPPTADDAQAVRFRRPAVAGLLMAALLLALFAAGCVQEQGEDAPADASAKATPAERSVQGPAGGRISLTAPEEAPPAPELTVETLGGETVPLAKSGQVTLVNFWATWCGPCRIEIPDLVALQDELGPQGLRIVGVAVGEDAAAVRPFAEERGINYALVPDADQSIAEAFGGVMGLPTTVVIGPDGTIRARLLGLFPTDEMKSQLQALLQEGAS